MAPITLVYTSAFLRYVVLHAGGAHGLVAQEQFELLAAITMYLVVLIFCVSLLYVVIKFVFLSNYQVNEFKMWLAAAETAFGALIGIVFEHLFGAKAP